MIFSTCGFNLFSMIFSMTLHGWLMRLIVRQFWHCCRLPFTISPAEEITKQINKHTNIHSYSIPIPDVRDVLPLRTDGHLTHQNFAIKKKRRRRRKKERKTKRVIRVLSVVVAVPRHNSLSKTVLHGTLEAGRRRGRQRKCRMDNIKEWTSLPSCKKEWRRISTESSVMSLRNPTGQGTELNLTFTDRAAGTLDH